MVANVLCRNEGVEGKVAEMNVDLEGTRWEGADRVVDCQKDGRHGRKF
jgi:hypothetical protein